MLNDPPPTPYARIPRLVVLNVATLLAVAGMLFLTDGLLPAHRKVVAIEGRGLSVTNTVELTDTSVMYNRRAEPGFFHPTMSDHMMLVLEGKEYHLKTDYIQLYREADSVALDRSALLGMTKGILPHPPHPSMRKDVTNESPHYFFPLVPILLLLPLGVVYLRRKTDRGLILHFLAFTPVAIYGIWRLTMLLMLYEGI